MAFDMHRSVVGCERRTPFAFSWLTKKKTALAHSNWVVEHTNHLPYDVAVEHVSTTTARRRQHVLRECALPLLPCLLRQHVLRGCALPLLPCLLRQHDREQEVQGREPQHVECKRVALRELARDSCAGQRAPLGGVPPFPRPRPAHRSRSQYASRAVQCHPEGVDSVSPAHLHVRPMGVHRTCRWADKIKKNAHPKIFTVSAGAHYDLI